jgi:DNA polymerase III subunit epsilon
MRLADVCGCFPTGKHYPGIAHLLKVRAVGVALEHDASSAWAELPVVMIDTETTGRDANLDRIVEIGAVISVRGEVVARWSHLVNPGRPIPAETTAVHGIKDADVADAPSFGDIAAELLTFIGSAIPAAYNAGFDRAFILAELDRAQVRPASPPPMMRRDVEWLDPLIFARELYKEAESRALGEMAKRLGVEMKRAHRATDDAEAALEVLHALAKDTRVPRAYGGLVQEQRRLSREQDDARKLWRKPN